MRSTAPKYLRWLLLLWTIAIHAQTCMLLSRPVLTPDGTMTFDLSLRSASGARASTLQWTFQYSIANIAALRVDDGPALAPSGKSTFCAGNPGSLDCVAGGFNRNIISDGIVAKVTATLGPGFDSANLIFSSALGASPEGFFISVMAKSNADAHSNCAPQPHRKGDAGK